MEQEKDYTSFGGRPFLCERCHGKMVYVAGGQYKCENCDTVGYDDFGKVKKFLEEYGRAPASVIAQATGVKEPVIRNLLKEGRIQIAPDSKMFLKCEKCGADIRFGRYCESCIQKAAGRLKNNYDSDDVMQERLDKLESQLSGTKRFYR